MTNVWLTPILVIAAVLAYRFPIYVRHGTKLHVFTVPIYLLAVLLPWAVAAPAGGLAILLGELATRGHTGNLPGDIARSTIRWTVLIAAAAAIGGISGLPLLVSLL